MSRAPRPAVGSASRPEAAAPGPSSRDGSPLLEGPPSPDPDARVGAVFAALADPTRRDVLRRLAGSGTVTASGLAEELPMTRQAAAKHLQALAGAGLVVGAREGRETRYSAVPGALDDAAAWMGRVGARWDDRLERLRVRVDG